MRKRTRSTEAAEKRAMTEPLPRTEGRAAATPPDAAGEKPVGASQPRSSSATLAEEPRPQPRILVVDDEPHVVQIFQDLLAQRGYEVSSSSNGDDAIVKVTTGRFDLVLTDINLPGVDGLEVVRAAKAADKDTCVILITGYASTTTAIDALRQGAYDYITKPFDLWETAKAIERGLESRFLVIENRRLVTSLGEANRELQQHEQILSRMVKEATQRITALYEAGKEISTSLSRQATLEVVVNQVAKLARAEMSMVFLYDTDAGEYVAEAGAGVSPDLLKHFRFGNGVGLPGQSVRNASPVRCAKVPETVGVDAFLTELEASSALVVPLLTNENVLGTITALRRTGRPFTPDDQELLTMFASQASIAVTNAILYERTKELDRMKSEFVAVVSHEVRTPLTSIKGSLELLGDERFHVLPPPQKELLSICQANTERLISLINDILDFSKLESSKLSLNFETIDIGKRGAPASGSSFRRGSSSSTAEGSGSIRPRARARRSRSRSRGRGSRVCPLTSSRKTPRRGPDRSRVAPARRLLLSCRREDRPQRLRDPPRSDQDGPDIKNPGAREGSPLGRL